MDEAAILRKIAALLARAEDSASSPAEVAHAIRTADVLMRRYNLTRDEVRLRREEMRRCRWSVGRDHSDYANTMAVAIAKLAQCRISGERGQRDHYTFAGLRVDVDYAEWLFRASWSALRQGWDAYKLSPQHARLTDEGGSPAAIEHHFKLGFSMDLAERIKKLVQDHAAAAGTALIALKNELIEQTFGTAKGTSTTSVAVRSSLFAAYRAGAYASRDVGLRPAIGDDKPPLLETP
jgi:hypothetical protein